jgi:hypothetical protein
MILKNHRRYNSHGPGYLGEISLKAKDREELKPSRQRNRTFQFGGYVTKGSKLGLKMMDL